MADPRQLDEIARVAPILRGLLAEPTGNDDQPFQPPILKSISGKKNLRKALQLEPVPKDESDDGSRSRFAAVLQKNKTKPEFISLANGGAFQIVNSKPGSAHGVRLAGRTAIVTGAAGAIGYGICKGLLEQGCHVAITDLPGEKF